MIPIRPSRVDELIEFITMASQPHAKNFVTNSDLETHQKNFHTKGITYLSVEDSTGELAGYFILVNEPETQSVEFHRVVIDQDKRGIGQVAISQMEHYCKNVLKAEKIWLDVYADNRIGVHIYQKLGYVKFKEELNNGRSLLFYKKELK